MFPSPPILLGRVWLLITYAVVASAQSALLYDANPGPAQVSIQGGTLILENRMFSARWTLAHDLSPESELIVHHKSIPPADQSISLSKDLFVLTFRDGHVVRASDMIIKDGPQIEHLDVDAEALQSAQHSPGQVVVLNFQDEKQRLSVTWRGILRDNSNYVRQEISLHAEDDQPISEIKLIDVTASTAQVDGTVKGSPVVVGDVFFGFEHPLSACEVTERQATCFMRRESPLRAGQTVTYSSVIGVSSPGQLRRGFLNYVESERPRAYRPFLHYNSWYDIGYGKPYDEADALDVIHSFGKELVQKRHVQLDSFLFDDGWDDPHTLWSFGAGFPHGFTPLKAAAEQYKAAPGVWLSPWGGYEEAKEERLKFGRKRGMETNKEGFALSGPRYYARFREVTLRFIRDFGINQFKIDGTGNVNSVLPSSQFDSDFQAAISLISEWRSVKPDIFINLTTGTYPSPFWLRYADSIWRGGEDHDFAGVGPWRERWITYRDTATYRHVVQAGPLFPLNSLMLHGLIFARQAEHLGNDPSHDFCNEVHSYLGSGTQLQEMYISHSLLSEQDWDTLAEAARWARNNAGTLVDTHWIGGDPGKLEVYGWAAWSPQKGILTLRNPNDKPQSYVLDVAKAFALPAHAPRRYLARSPWLHDRAEKPFHLIAGERYTFMLKAFEVLNLEALPE